MSGLTAIKVRGKRSGAAAGQWHKNKHRPAPKLSSPLSSRANSTTPQSHHDSTRSKSRKRKRQNREPSRLEELPSEVLQTIFLYSRNLDLPCVSPILLAQLSSVHLYDRLTYAILSDTISLPGESPPPASLKAVSRLLECRFMTMAFFDRCTNRLGDGPVKHTPDTDSHIHSPVLAGLKHIPLPRKLMTPPWSSAEIEFIFVLSSYGSRDNCDPEALRQARFRAIEDANTKALGVFSEGGGPKSEAWVDTETLRKAVIDHGCDIEVVRFMLDATWAFCPDLDLLDEELWKWAQLACAQGDEKGKWLIRKLKKRIRQTS